MASDNFTVQVGNLTDDPELRFTTNGTSVTNFRLAVNQRIREADGTWRDGETSFFRVNAWRDQAENIAESLAKGNRAVVLGRLRTRSCETPDGEKRSVTEIDADEVAPSLRWAITKPEQVERSRNGERGAERDQIRWTNLRGSGHVSCKKAGPHSSERAITYNDEVTGSSPVTPTTSPVSSASIDTATPVAHCVAPLVSGDWCTAI
jgi:single-strand DNA-binding protein